MRAHGTKRRDCQNNGNHLFHLIHCEMPCLWYDTLGKETFTSCSIVARITHCLFTYNVWARAPEPTDTDTNETKQRKTNE